MIYGALRESAAPVGQYVIMKTPDNVCFIRIRTRVVVRE